MSDFVGKVCTEKASPGFGAVVRAQGPSGEWERGIVLGQKIVGGTQYFTIAVMDISAPSGYDLLTTSHVEALG